MSGEDSAERVKRRMRQTARIALRTAFDRVPRARSTHNTERLTRRVLELSKRVHGVRSHDQHTSSMEREQYLAGWAISAVGLSRQRRN
jgi:hypothetical protein